MFNPIKISEEGIKYFDIFKNHIPTTSSRVLNISLPIFSLFGLVLVFKKPLRDRLFVQLTNLFRGQEVADKLEAKLSSSYSAEIHRQAAKFQFKTAIPEDLQLDINGIRGRKISPDAILEGKEEASSLQTFYSFIRSELMTKPERAATTAMDLSKLTDHILLRMTPSRALAFLYRAFCDSNRAETVSSEVALENWADPMKKLEFLLCSQKTKMDKELVIEAALGVRRTTNRAFKDPRAGNQAGHIERVAFFFKRFTQQYWGGMDNPFLFLQSIGNHSFSPAGVLFAAIAPLAIQQLQPQLSPLLESKPLQLGLTAAVVTSTVFLFFSVAKERHALVRDLCRAIEKEDIPLYNLFKAHSFSDIFESLKGAKDEDPDTRKSLFITYPKVTGKDTKPNSELIAHTIAEGVLTGYGGLSEKRTPIYEINLSDLIGHGKYVLNTFVRLLNETPPEAYICLMNFDALTEGNLSKTNNLDKDSLLLLANNIAERIRNSKNRFIIITSEAAAEDFSNTPYAKELESKVQSVTFHSPVTLAQEIDTFTQIDDLTVSIPDGLRTYLKAIPKYVDPKDLIGDIRQIIENKNNQFLHKLKEIKTLKLEKLLSKLNGFIQQKGRLLRELHMALQIGDRERAYQTAVLILLSDALLRKYQSFMQNYIRTCAQGSSSKNKGYGWSLEECQGRMRRKYKHTLCCIDTAEKQRHLDSAKKLSLLFPGREELFEQALRHIIAKRLRPPAIDPSSPYGSFAPQTFILMDGPSGGGKSLAARALASEITRNLDLLREDEQPEANILPIALDSWSAEESRKGIEAQIARFVSEYPQGIILINDIDQVPPAAWNWVKTFFEPTDTTPNLREANKESRKATTHLNRQGITVIATANFNYRGYKDGSSLDERQGQLVEIIEGRYGQPQESGSSSLAQPKQVSPSTHKELATLKALISRMSLILPFGRLEKGQCASYEHNHLAYMINWVKTEHRLDLEMDPLVAELFGDYVQKNNGDLRKIQFCLDQIIDLITDELPVVNEKGIRIYISEKEPKDRKSIKFNGKYLCYEITKEDPIDPD